MLKYQIAVRMWAGELVWGACHFAKYPACLLTSILRESVKLRLKYQLSDHLTLASSENKWCPKGCGKLGRPHGEGKYKCERCGFEWSPENKGSK